MYLTLISPHNPVIELRLFVFSKQCLQYYCITTVSFLKLGKKVEEELARDDIILGGVSRLV